MSAASRVFGLPELLETILLELAAQVMIIDGDGKSPTGANHVLEPITSLDPLHVINHTFNNLLKRSSRLQRAMFSQSGFMTRKLQMDRFYQHGAFLTWPDHDIAVAKVPVLPLIPFEWLCRKPNLTAPTNFHQHHYAVELTIDTCQTALSNYRTRFKKLMASNFGAANACWRRLQMFQSDDTSERLQRVLVSFDAPVRWGYGAGYFEWFVLEDGTTLGEVFERITGIIHRKQRHRIAAANGL